MRRRIRLGRVRRCRGGNPLQCSRDISLTAISPAAGRRWVQHYFVAALIPLVASSRAIEQKPQRSDAIAFFQFLAVFLQNADELVAFPSTYTFVTASSCGDKHKRVTATDFLRPQAALHSPPRPWPYH